MKTVNKYFISCINQTEQLGVIQFESDEDSYQEKAESICPEQAFFRAYIVDEFDENIPLDEFVSIEKMK